MLISMNDISCLLAYLFLILHLIFKKNYLHVIKIFAPNVSRTRRLFNEVVLRLIKSLRHTVNGGDFFPKVLRRLIEREMKN